MLTPEQVAALSGRELDAAVAVHVMGWRWVWNWCGTARLLQPPGSESDLHTHWPQTPCDDAAVPVCRDDGRLPLKFSGGDANLALAVLCKARGEPPCDYLLGNTSKSGPGHLCELTRDGVSSFTGYGATISEAICRCALLAVQG